MERLKTIDIDHPLGNVRLKIPNVEKRNLPAFRSEDLSIGYPNHLVADKINIEFNQGVHIAVLGDNGQGKTTFMRTIVGDLEAKSGNYKWGHSLKIGYYAQHVLQSLDPRDDVIGHLKNKAENFVTEQEILNLAGSFLFKGDDVLKKVKVLSGGEKARLCLAGLLLSKSDCLLLDEPTNHLDFETVEALGSSLRTFNGTILFISHDRTFVNMLATEIIEVKDGTILRYPGNYEEYVYSMETRVRNELTGDESVKSKKPVYNKIPSGKPVSAPVKNLKAEIAKINLRIKEIQTRFEAHKKEWEDLNQLFMNDSSNWSVERSSRYQYLEKIIREDEDLWLELTNKVEDLTKKAGSN